MTVVKSAETGIRKCITQLFLKSYTDQILSLINSSLFIKYLSIIGVSLSIIIGIYLYLNITINIHYVLKLNLHKHSSIFNCYSQTNKQRSQADFIHDEYKLKDLYSIFGLVFMLLKTDLNSDWMKNKILCRWAYERKCHSHINCITKE